MIIEVRECDEVVFNGDADEFLFMQDNDIELENLLDSDTWIPYIVCCVCLAWFILFMFVNREYLRKHRMIY